MAASLLDTLLTRDAAAVRALLADDVRFRSPAADYAGRDDVAHLLATIGGVLTAVEVTRAIVDGPATTTFLRGRVAEHELQGVLDELRGPDGRVTDAMLLLRPHGAVRAAIGAMRARLAEDPLPGARD